MEAFRIPAQSLKAARRAVGPLVVQVESTRDFIVSAETARHLSKSSRVLRDLESYPIDAARWDETQQRLHAFWAAIVSEGLPEPVALEARLILYGDPALELEFMGRGHITSERHLPSARETLVQMDIAGGRRHYLFRKLQAPVAHLDERMIRTKKSFGEWREWVCDDDARIVISLGGGGFRLFAAVSVLKAIDLLVGDRSRVAEIWGSSGGAFLGHLYASGFPLSAIDTFAYDLYNNRLPHLVSGSLSSLARSYVGAQMARWRGRDVPPEMVDWLVELDRRVPNSQRLPPRPFYAIASSTRRQGLTALTAPELVSPACKDFMLASDPRLAVAASTAVPFVLRPVRGIGDANESWFDGSIADENPLALPYVKWIRERDTHPESTPRRLKIVLVNLNLRSSESELLGTLARSALLRPFGLDRSWQIADRLLDSKTTTNIQIVTAIPGVEVLSCKLNLGWLSLHNPREIAKAVRSGRTLECWEIALHRHGH